MFATLRPDKDAVLRIDSEQPASRRLRLSTCRNCRSVKLKCSRDYAGCQRCTVKKLPCDYSRSAQSRKARRRSGKDLNMAESSYCDSLGGSQFDVPESSMVPHAQAFAANGDEPPAFSTQMDSSYFELLDNDSPYQQYTQNQDFSSLFESTLWASCPGSSSSSENFMGITGSNSTMDAPLFLLGHSGMSNPCNCLGTTTSFLEAVSVETVRSDLKSVPRTLHLTRRVLAQFKKLIICKRCSNMSDFLMLLIVLSQKISTAYGTTIILLTEQYNKLSMPDRPQEEEHEQASESLMDIAIGIDAEDHGTSMGYKVEVEEQPCVFGGVITLQLQKMIILLRTLKAALVRGEKHSHITMLNSVGSQIKEHLRFCTSYCGVGPGDEF